MDTVTKSSGVLFKARPPSTSKLRVLGHLPRMSEGNLLPDSEYEKTGWLLKQGEKGSGGLTIGLKGWKKRFFRLDDSKLGYYKKEKVIFVLNFRT